MLDLSTTSFQALFEYVSANSSKFEDGRINYRTSRMNLVLATLVIQNDKILLLKRSKTVLTYSGLRDFVGGYLDDGKVPEEKAIEELEEELGISGPNDIKSLKSFSRVIQYDDVINKVWVNFPMIIILKDNVQIILDDEHDEYKRIEGEELGDYELVPGTLELYDYIQTFSDYN